MSKENLPLTRIDRGADQNQWTRRWHCPEDRVIAAYVDGALMGARRSRVQGHLADCSYCRSLVADLVKIRREAEVPAAPTALIDRALADLPASPRRWPRIWAPVSVLGAAAVCALIALTVLRQPERPVLPSRSAPSAPIVSDSEPQSPAGPPGHEIVRSQTSPQPSLSIISPKPGGEVSRETAEVRWKAVPRSLYYQVRILTSEGEVSMVRSSNCLRSGAGRGASFVGRNVYQG
jgi:hypothetical protein